MKFILILLALVSFAVGGFHVWGLMEAVAYGEAQAQPGRPVSILIPENAYFLFHLLAFFLAPVLAWSLRKHVPALAVAAIIVLPFVTFALFGEGKFTFSLR